MSFVPYTPAPRTKAVARSRLQVLYVEDEDANWELTANELGREFAIVRAKDAREAFHRLAQQRFDLVLMDIQLSGSDLDGIAITRICRRKYGDPIPVYARNLRTVDEPIVFVTAYSACYTKESLVAAGGDDMTTKPVDFSSLRAVLSRLIMVPKASQ